MTRATAPRIMMETPRLRLRELEPSDLDFVAAMLCDAEVMRYYPSTYSRNEAEQWLERQRARYRRDGHGLWLVEERASGVSVGQVGLVFQDVNGERLPEVGYLIHRPWWRRGYASEAARAVRDHAFDALDYPRVVSLIRQANGPSQGVARKLGMQRVGSATHGAAGLDHLVFSLERPAAGVSRTLSREGP